MKNALERLETLHRMLGERKKFNNALGMRRDMTYWRYCNNKTPVPKTTQLACEYVLYLLENAERLAEELGTTKEALIEPIINSPDATLTNEQFKAWKLLYNLTFNDIAEAFECKIRILQRYCTTQPIPKDVELAMKYLSLRYVIER